MNDLNKNLTEENRVNGIDNIFCTRKKSSVMKISVYYVLVCVFVCYFL